MLYEHGFCQFHFRNGFAVLEVLLDGLPVVSESPQQVSAERILLQWQIDSCQSVLEGSASVDVFLCTLSWQHPELGELILESYPVGAVLWLVCALEVVPGCLGWFFVCCVGLQSMPDVGGHALVQDTERLQRELLEFHLERRISQGWSDLSCIERPYVC